MYVRGDFAMLSLPDYCNLATADVQRILVIITMVCNGSTLDYYAGSWEGLSVWYQNDLKSSASRYKLIYVLAALLWGLSEAEVMLTHLWLDFIAEEMSLVQFCQQIAPTLFSSEKDSPAQIPACELVTLRCLMAIVRNRHLWKPVSLDLHKCQKR